MLCIKLHVHDIPRIGHGPTSHITFPSCACHKKVQEGNKPSVCYTQAIPLFQVIMTTVESTVFL